MYNEKFTLHNGTEIFPNYMNTEQRSLLKQQIGEQSEVMWCSCRTDKKLYYRLSENLRFYPEHNGYEHSPYCIRYHTVESKRRTAIIHNDEETATVYLQFNPKNFTMPSTNPDDDTEDNNEESNEGKTEDNLSEESSSLSTINSISSDSSEENELIHLNKIKVDSDNYKEPKFNLANFIRCINYDTFNERIINHKPLLSYEYFANALIGRLKNIRISGMSKNVRNLSLEEDGVRFFYAPFIGCDVKKSQSYTSYNIKIKGHENNVYTLFTFGVVYEKALKRFHKQYGIEPNEYTMVAGFQYYPISKSGNHYKVIGRLQLFQVSNHGLYCNSLFEIECFNIIINYIKKHTAEYIRFYIPTEDELINGIIEVEGFNKKGIIIFPSTKASKEFTIDYELFEPLVVDTDLDLSENVLNGFIKRIKTN